MQKLKIIEWIQLVFMFLVTLVIMGIVVQLTSPNEWLNELSNSTNYTCYSILYFDSSASPYICAICKTPEAFPDILRIAPKAPPIFTSNHLSDIVVLTIVTVGGLASWGLYSCRVLRKYLPWM